MKPYIELPSYSIAVGLGWLACVSLAFFRKKRYGFNHRILIIYAVAISVFTILGSKLVFLVTQIPKIIEEFSIYNLIHSFITSGFVYYGGIYGAIFGVIFVSKLLNLGRLQLMNFSAPLFALFHAFGRVGCFLGGCCYGIPYKYGVAMADTPDIKRFPVQLLESLVEFLICGFLLYCEKKKNNLNLMKRYLIIYAIARFGMEFLRGDDLRGIWIAGLSTSQIIALLTVVGCIIHSLVMIRNGKK